MFVLLLLLAAISGFAADAKLTPEMQAVVSHISAASLQENLSFIASDRLEGRATPSRGLDLAAEYIAAQFKSAGLEPVGDDGYYQTATLSLRAPNWEGFQMTVTEGGKPVGVKPVNVKPVNVKPGEIYLLPDAPLNLDEVPVVVLNRAEEITSETVNGKVVLVANPRLMGRLQVYQPALIFSVARELPSGPQVRDAENVRRGFPLTAIVSPELARMLADGKAKLTLHMAAALERSAKVHNVVGLLRGSDPALRDTYVMLTAHYDHVGMRDSGADRIYNGANDDGSGTVSVIEIARALAALNPRPKRSILFVTFFGEERGLLGSRYYGRHPVVPLQKTIADLNLEQIGRTDASNGRQIGTATITGFDFSEVPHIIEEAGRLTGVRVYKDEEASDAYFARSDNQALADVGVPAHTLCVAFNYPDYHGVGDEWQKIDYANMAKVDDAIAIGLMHLASDAPPPKWNDSNPAARKYVEAAEKLPR
jgi:hypothetical protein